MEEAISKKERDHRRANAIYTIGKYLILSLILALLIDGGLYIYRWQNGDIEEVVLEETPEGYEPEWEDGVHYAKPWEALYYMGRSCYDESIHIGSLTADDLNYRRQEGLKNELTRVGLIAFGLIFFILVSYKYIIPRIVKGAKWVMENK